MFDQRENIGQAKATPQVNGLGQTRWEIGLWVYTGFGGWSDRFECGYWGHFGYAYSPDERESMLAEAREKALRNSWRTP